MPVIYSINKRLLHGSVPRIDNSLPNLLASIVNDYPILLSIGRSSPLEIGNGSREADFAILNFLHFCPLTRVMAAGRSLIHYCWKAHHISLRKIKEFRCKVRI